MPNGIRRVVALAVAGVVIAGGAGTAYAAMSSAGPSYRLASVSPATETAALHEVGTLTPTRQADVAFSVDGTVRTVGVKPGQQVTAGQKLGSLDTTALQASLTAARSTLANANLQVSNDMKSQNATATAATSTSAAASRGASASAPSASPLRPLQRAVLTAQHAADAAFAQARTDLSLATQVCGRPPSPPATPSPRSSGASGPAPSPRANGPSSLPSPAAPSSLPSPAAPSSLPAGDVRVTCSAATRRVLDAENAVLQAEEALSGRLTTLGQALARAVAKAGQPAAGRGSADPPAPGRGGGPGGPVSPAQLAADQAAADAAAVQVTAAQQDLAAATVVSPLSGTVVTVSVTPGASATPGSTAFAIAGLGSYQVVTDVPVTDMPRLKVGQQASVLPDGTGTPLSGSVVSIGLIPDSTGSPATYPVTIGLTGAPAGLHADGLADVTIVTAQASGVSVPTSALHISGHQATVTVYAEGKTRAIKVTVGTMGPVMTRITAGLTLGQQVVLANLNQPLPNNNVSNPGPGPGGPGFFQGPGGGQFIGPGG